MKLTPPLIASILLSSAPPALAKIDIVFDYTYDSSHFFADSARQNLLNSAAFVFENRLDDTLSGIAPSGSNHFDLNFDNPSLPPSNAPDSFNTSVSDHSIATNEIIVFVGAYDMGGDTLGMGGPGGFEANGSQDFVNNAFSRGQAGALASPETDFGPWGGTLSFNSNSATNYYFDDNAATDETFSGFDFYSIAVHELGHLLGFGTAYSYFNNVTNGLFTGTAVTTLTGQQPVTGDGGHWEEGLIYGVQETAMSPSIAAGTRKRFTELDFAAMKDIGWEVSPVPEAETWGMLLAGLGLLGWRMRTRARNNPQR